MALRWKLSEKETGLAAVGAGRRSCYLKEDGEEIILVYPIGGAAFTGEFKGYRWKLIGDRFGQDKFKVGKGMFDTLEEAKAKAKSWYLENKSKYC